MQWGTAVKNTQRLDSTWFSSQWNFLKTPFAIVATVFAEKP